MPPDPLVHPIAALTDHRVLSDDEEAALIETMLAGAHARAALHTAPPAAITATQDQITHGEAARATLIRHNLRLVVAIAKRYQRTAGHHLTLDDLVSFGCRGLLIAVDRFDPAKSRKLSTYATWWIRQAISRGIADEGRVIDLPVHIHERLAQLARARATLGQQLQREPTADELATATGWPLRRVAGLIANTQDVASLNARLADTDDSAELGDVLPDQRFDPATAALESSIRHDLADAMARLLTEREQRFVRAYVGFGTGQKATLEAIGTQEGLTRERVRQVIAGALQKLHDDPVVASYQAAGADA
jgi:RNA polymerase sigma factor (sigma-70 family)